MTRPNTPYTLAIDQGGHASRAMVFDAQGQCLGEASFPIQTIVKGDDCIEHDPEEMLLSVHQCIETVLTDIGDDSKRILKAGLATQRSTIVCWDRKSGVALSPIISWQDRRAAGVIEALADKADEIKAITGLFPNAHYGASKIAWCLKNIDAVRQAQKEHRLLAGPLSTFLLFNLTVEQACFADPANGSRTMLVNLARQCWDERLLRWFDIPGDILPTLVDTEFRFGTLKVNDNKFPIEICTGDQSAVLFANGQPKPGVAYINAGTGAFIQLPTNDPLTIPQRLLGSLAFSHGEERLIIMEGTVNGAARALHWYAEQAGLDESDFKFDEWDRQLEALPIFINGVSGVGSPFWLPRLESRFSAQSTDHRENLMAVMESIVFLIVNNLNAMQENNAAINMIHLSGGLSNIRCFCQRLADLSGLPLEKANISEGTALGLAYLLTDNRQTWASGLPESVVFHPMSNIGLEARWQYWLNQMPRA